MPPLSAIHKPKQYPDLVGQGLLRRTLPIAVVLKIGPGQAESSSVSLRLIEPATQGTSPSASISERRPVFNYRCFGYVPAGAEDPAAGDGGEPTSAIACLEQEPVELAKYRLEC